MAGGLSQYTKRPWMPAIWAFYKMHGRQAGFIQAAEVALRRFEETAPKNPVSFDKFLHAQASKHGLSIAPSAFRDARRSAARWYIVETYQIWQSFVSRLNNEYRKYKRVKDWKIKKHARETLTGFHQLLLNLPKEAADFLRAQPEFGIFEYYLAVRNWIIHPNSQTALTANETLDELFETHGSNLKKLCSTSAPNTISSLNFDDYMLFSKAMVFFATMINDACNLQNEEIEPHLYVAARQSLRDHQAKIGRIKSVAVTYYRVHHGSNNKLANDFGDYVVERFRSGTYFR
jgi:hypothetical protein